jgi:cytochrome P450
VAIGALRSIELNESLGTAKFVEQLLWLARPKLLTFWIGDQQWRADLVDHIGEVVLAGRGDRLSEQELFANIVLLLIAGHENSTSLIGTAPRCCSASPKSAQSWRETRPGGRRPSRS